jgi:hypothetical protein
MTLIFCLTRTTCDSVNLSESRRTNSSPVDEPVMEVRTSPSQDLQHRLHATCQVDVTTRQVEISTCRAVLSSSSAFFKPDTKTKVTPKLFDPRFLFKVTGPYAFHDFHECGGNTFINAESRVLEGGHSQFDREHQLRLLKKRKEKNRIPLEGKLCGYYS